jgi:hypothetical protein
MCGLHFGWAVEGAISSDEKIDASYISPHVNWSEFLESSSKEYDVPILISEPFYKSLSPNVARHCRKVDSIRNKEVDEVMALCTYDANLDMDIDKEPLLNFTEEARARRRTHAMNNKKAASNLLQQLSTDDVRARVSVSSIVSFMIYRYDNICSSVDLPSFLVIRRKLQW